MSEFGKRESSIRWVIGLDSWKCAYKMMHIKFPGQVLLYCVRNHFPSSQLQVFYPLNHNECVMNIYYVSEMSQCTKDI